MIYIYVYYINWLIYIYIYYKCKYIWCNPQIHSTLPDLCNSGSPTSLLIVPQDVLKAIASLKEGQAEVSVGAVNGPKMTVVSGQMDFDDFGTERRLELCNVGPPKYSWQKLWISMEWYGLMWDNKGSLWDSCQKPSPIWVSVRYTPMTGMIYNSSEWLAKFYSKWATFVHARTTHPVRIDLGSDIMFDICNYKDLFCQRTFTGSRLQHEVAKIWWMQSWRLLELATRLGATPLCLKPRLSLRPSRSRASSMTFTVFKLKT